MLETPEQKQTFAGCIILIVILVAVSFWHRPNLAIKNNQQNAGQEFLKSKAYLEYFRAANTDQKASQQLFQTILTKEDITKEVEKDLQVSQTITPPAINETKIKISPVNTRDSVNGYLSQSISLAYTFSTSTQELAKDIFADANAAGQIKSELQDSEARLYSLSVPKDALALHKALITAYAGYAGLLNASGKYNANDALANEAVWPQVYKAYTIANDSAKVYSVELNKLALKYKISAVPVYFASEKPSKNLGNIFIPEAHAFLGIGDVTFSTTIGDIPRLVMDGIKEGVRSAFLQFTGAMLNKFITKIEQNYSIANFLYYSDALVSGQYVNDYLNKYVSDPLDRSLVKKFIPQLNCGKNPDLKAVFQAQADQYLGYDPATLDLNDPNYYEKMARAGNFLASPQGWESYYQGLAVQAQTQAQRSADLELTSSGLKTPRNTIQSNISASINSIVGAESAGFNALFNLGISNSDSIISKVVANLTQTLVNQFVFQGATSNGGNIAVYKEQPTCLSVPVLNPVIPLPTTDIQPPTPGPTEQSAIAQQCSFSQNLNDNCTSAVLAELAICASSPGSHTGTQTCGELLGSTYSQTLLAECSKQIRPTQECSDLQEYFDKVR